MQLAETQIFALIRLGEGRIFRLLPAGERSALTRRGGTSAGPHRLNSRDTSWMFPSHAAACPESRLIPATLMISAFLTAAIAPALSRGAEAFCGRPPRRAGPVRSCVEPRGAGALPGRSRAARGERPITAAGNGRAPPIGGSARSSLPCD